MLSYLVAIIRLKNFRIDYKQVKKLTDTKTSRWTQKQKNSLKTNIVVNAVPPDTEYLYYPLNVEGVTQKSSLFPAHIRLKKIIITILTLMCQCQFSFLRDKKKKSPEFLFYPTSSPHKKPGKYVHFDSPAGKILKG